MLASTSKPPEDREFVVDSGGFVRMLRKIFKLTRHEDGSTLCWVAFTTHLVFFFFTGHFALTSFNVSSHQKRVQINWIFCEDPGTPLWCVQPMKTFTTAISSWQCKFSKKRLQLSHGKLCEDQGYSYESKTTVGQRREDNYPQNDHLRTSCRSRLIHQFWGRFVLNIDIEGFVLNKSSPRARWRFRNVLRKWCQNQGSTAFKTHFPKDRNCEVCLLTQQWNCRMYGDKTT